MEKSDPTPTGCICSQVDCSEECSSDCPLREIIGELAPKYESRLASVYEIGDLESEVHLKVIGFLRRTNKPIDSLRAVVHTVLRTTRIDMNRKNTIESQEPDKTGKKRVSKTSPLNKESHDTKQVGDVSGTYQKAEKDLLTHELERAVKKALESLLSEEDRELAYDRWWRCYTLKELGAKHGVTPQAMHKRLKGIKTHLKPYLRPYAD